MSNLVLSGFVPAVVTPFSEDGEIIEDAFQGVVDHMLSIGATAVCVAGDNGESWSLDVAERRRLTALAVERSGDRPVLTGVSAPTKKQALAYAAAARDGGASAMLAMPPTYVLKGSRDELLRRFEALGSVGLPIVLYNSPRRAGFELSVEDIEAIADVSPVVAVKESSRDFFHHTHLLHRLGKRLSIMTGPSHFILPCAALGAAGYIATGPELLGPTGSRLTEIGRAAPDHTYAETHHRLAILYQLLMATGTWPSALKAALNLIGLPAGMPRDPVLPLEGAALERVRATLDELSLLG